MMDDIFDYYDSDAQMSKIKGLREWYRHQHMGYILPERVTEISSSAFMRCGATAFLLPEGLAKIGAMAFYCCKDLQMVYIPKSVKIIGNNVFDGCDNLQIYCEGEPAKGWIEEPPEYRTERVTTDEDYAFDFHRGGVSYTNIKVRVSKHWNPDNRPVHKNYSREEFIKKFNALISRT